jgi:hypothetical protein
MSRKKIVIDRISRTESGREGGIPVKGMLTDIFTIQMISLSQNPAGLEETLIGQI